MPFLLSRRSLSIWMLLPGLMTAWWVVPCLAGSPVIPGIKVGPMHVAFVAEDQAQVARRVALQPSPRVADQVVPWNAPPGGNVILPRLARFDPFSGAGGGWLSMTPPVLTDFAGMEDTGWRPPDTIGAAGPSHLVSFLNGGVAWWTKLDGTELFQTTLVDFFAPLGELNGFTFDPRVVFDHHSGRFIATAVDGNRTEYGVEPPSWLLIAVTESSDPTGTWYKWKIDADVDYGSVQTDQWADYEALGVDEHAIYVSANMFGPEFYVKMWVIPKAQLLAGSPTITWTEFSEVYWPAESVQPCVTFGTPDRQYLINASGWGGSELYVWSISDPLGSPSLNYEGAVNVGWYDWPPDASQPGGPETIATNDARLINAVYRNGHVYAAHCVWGQGPAASRWYQIDPLTRSVVQSGMISDASRDYYYPAVNVDAAGNMAIAFSGSSPSEYASAYYTGRAVDDPPGTVQTPTLYKAGEAYYDRGRWGDYSIVAVDPTDDLTFWALQEYAETPDEEDRWGTWWAKFTFKRCPADLNGDNVVDFTDVTVLSLTYLKSYGQAGYNGLADLNNDGLVDFTDVTIFSNHYLVPCP